MDNKDWHGLMRIIEICHVDRKGNVIYRDQNLLNILHAGGEEFLLRAAFTGGRVSTVIPDFYYLGLDNRQTINAADTMDNLIGEPSGSGYQRQQVASSGDFSINFQNSHYLATSPIVAFQATTTGWGPVSNLFLTDKNDNTGSLISTITLTAPISLNPGDSVTMRIGMQLTDCPSS